MDRTENVEKSLFSEGAHSWSREWHSRMIEETQRDVLPPKAVETINIYGFQEKKSYIWE